MVAMGEPLKYVMSLLMVGVVADDSSLSAINDSAVLYALAAYMSEAGYHWIRAELARFLHA